MPPISPSKAPTVTPALTLLRRAHPEPTASTIHAAKIARKPLLLHRQPSTAPSNLSTGRTARHAARAAKAAAARRRSKNKPKPLSARDKRRLGVHKISPEEAARWDVWLGLWRMWCAYAREILGVGDGASAYVTPAQAGPKIASADLHGAFVVVVRSRCVDRVGVEGVVCKEGKFAVWVVAKDGKVRLIPKEHTVFRIEVPLVDAEDPKVDSGKQEEGEGGEGDGLRRLKPLVFEIHGSQFENRPPDRATKKFKMRLPSDL